MKRFFSVLLTAALLLGLCAVPAAAAPASVSAVLNDTAQYLVKTVPSPAFASAGGGWTVIALARSGYAVPDGYFDGYYQAIAAKLQANKGVLSERVYTEYERAILALTATGRDPANVAGYNLLAALGDFDTTVSTGLATAAFALIALDARGYAIPESAGAKTQATRQLYLAYLLNAQLADGGWALSGEKADPDVTAMVLQALAGYRSNAAVESAVTVGVACLSKLQNSDGGYSSWGSVNSESTSQVILALTSLGISVTDSRFVKNGSSPLDNLLSYYIPGGGFRHMDSADLLATEQALCALAAVQRAASGKNSIYDMRDVTLTAGSSESQAAAGVNPSAVVHPGLTFTDVQGHANQTAIEKLASYGIINGMGGGLFQPDATMTRAQFAAIVVRALGMAPEYRATFRDVEKSSWYAAYVDTAAAYGIVNGVGGGRFSPQGTITRQDAATMVARAAKLCGLDTAVSSDGARNTLAGFSDYTTVSSYASAPLAYCYRSGILDGSALTIQPKKAILRCEIAQMLYNLLQQTKLLQ